MQRSYFAGTWQKDRAFSPAVKTTGGTTVWVAGHTGHRDDSGKSLAGDLDAQVRTTFRNIEKTLAEVGAKLSDLVTMTVFINDARNSTRVTEIRKEIFGRNFPASALITVTGFAQPEILIEIQSIAVID